MVDDEPTLRLGFSYSLSNTSTLVDTAPTGRQALEKLNESSYDIVILDLRMPDIDGIGVITSLREAGNRVPIVLCSAAITPCALFQAIQYGVPDFVLKPIRPVDLRDVVKYVLDPPSDIISNALVAMRLGDMETALQHIRTGSNDDPRVNLWTEVFESHSQRNGTPLDENQERLFRQSLMGIAFRSTSTN